MSDARKCTCPACGVELNRHAEKLVAPISERDVARVDPDLGGIVEESHCCPACGRSAFARD